MPLPPNLAHAFARGAGSDLVLVLGAGCSIEDPTCLKAASGLAFDLHEQMVRDHVFQNGQCTDPYDLATVADCVEKVTGSRTALIQRLPVEAFRRAQTNTGHRHAAALMKERVISNIVTLNYDFAMSNALVELGVGAEVQTLSTAQEWSIGHGQQNLIYLHGHAYSDPATWVVTSSDINSKWQGGWQEIASIVTLPASAVVFAGIGTPVAVLIDSAKRVFSAILNHEKVFIADPIAFAQSALVPALETPATQYVRQTWCEFMRAGVERLALEHLDKLRQACQRLIDRNAFEQEDLVGLTNRLYAMDFVEIGELRARWMLMGRDRYLAFHSVDPELTADLVLGTALVERRGNCQASFRKDGSIEFRTGHALKARVLLASGRGTHTWNALEALITTRSSASSSTGDAIGPRWVVVSGSTTEPPNVSPPKNIVGSIEEADIVFAGSAPHLVHIERLRQQPDLVSRILEL